MLSAYNDRFKGSTSAYWGMAMITGILGGVGMLLDSVIVYGFSAIFGAMASYGFLLDRPKSIQLADGKVIIMRGMFSSVRSIDLAMVKSISLSPDRDKINPSLNLANTDLDAISYWGKHKYIVFEMKGDKGKRTSLHVTDFQPEIFIALAKSLKEFYIETEATPLQKIAMARKKTLQYIAEDKKLKQELKANLFDVYHSVYQPFEAHHPFEILPSKQVLQDFDRDEEIAFYTIRPGNVLIYFKHHHFSQQATPSSMAIAERLIATSRNNLDIVEHRLASHERVREKLEAMSLDFDRRQRLIDVASRLDALQQQNIKKSIFDADLGFEVEVINQLQELTENLQSADSLEQVNALYEQIKLIKNE